MRIIHEIDNTSNKRSSELGEEGEIDVGSDLTQHWTAERWFNTREGDGGSLNAVFGLEQRSDVLAKRTSSISSLIQCGEDEVNAEKALSEGGFEIVAARNGGTSSGNTTNVVLLETFSGGGLSSFLSAGEEFVDDFGDGHASANTDCSSRVLLKHLLKVWVSSRLSVDLLLLSEERVRQEAVASLVGSILVAEASAEDGETELGTADRASDGEDGGVELLKEFARDVTEESEDDMVSEGVRAQIGEG